MRVSGVLEAIKTGLREAEVAHFDETVRHEAPHYRVGVKGPHLRPVVDRYFGRFHPDRQTRWLFGDRESGAYLLQFAWTEIVRHDLVKGRASRDDPALAEYWAKRRRKNGDAPPIGSKRLHLLRKQQGRCPVCNGLLLYAEHPPRSPEEWEQLAKALRKAITVNAIAVTGGGTGKKEQHLVHEYCRLRKKARGSLVAQKACEPRGLLEPRAATSGTHGS